MLLNRKNDREEALQVLEGAIIQQIGSLIVGRGEYRPIHLKFDIGSYDSTLNVDLDNGQMKIEFRIRPMKKDTVWIKFSGFFSSDKDDMGLLNEILNQVNNYLPEESDRLKSRKSSKPGTKIFFWRG